tara:strand:+ start:12382 stop:12792 length:411 start_codon:yes stop_codon:yes gene_type:complete
MKKFTHIMLLCSVFILLACSTNTENLVSAPDDDDENPIENVSYANQVQPIFNSSCTSCHGSNGGVNLSSFSLLMGSVGNNYGNQLVVPNDADASGLVDKLEPSPDHGSRMPIGSSPLSSTQIETIRTWINEGATNN